MAMNNSHGADIASYARNTVVALHALLRKVSHHDARCHRKTKPAGVYAPCSRQTRKGVAPTILPLRSAAASCVRKSTDKGFITLAGLRPDAIRLIGAALILVDDESQLQHRFLQAAL